MTRMLQERVANTGKWGDEEDDRKFSESEFDRPRGAACHSPSSELMIARRLRVHEHWCPQTTETSPVHPRSSRNSLTFHALRLRYSWAVCRGPVGSRNAHVENSDYDPWVHLVHIHCCQYVHTHAYPQFPVDLESEVWNLETIMPRL